MADNIKFYVGKNIYTTHGFTTVVDHAIEVGATFFQIFLSSPQSYNRTQHSIKDITHIKNKLIESDVKMVIHGSYMLNFCNPVNSFIHTKAVEILSADLEDSIRFGQNTIGVIVHMGKNVKELNISNEQAIWNYVCGITVCF